MQKRERRDDLRRIRTYLLALRRRWLYENQRAHLEIHRLQEQRDSCCALLRWCSAKHAQLNSISVLNDCFNIWHSGQFATMNGLRIGRHPSNQVDWNEINAALGDVLLLLATVGFNFSRYVLLPMGNYSKLRSGAFAHLEFDTYQSNIQLMIKEYNTICIRTTVSLCYQSGTLTRRCVPF